MNYPRFLYSFACFAFITSSLVAQNYGGPNAKWTYSKFSFTTTGFIEITVRGDTTIAGQACQIYSKEVVEKDFPSNVINTYSVEPDYIFEEDKVLYIYDEQLQSFDTLFWFGANIGDQWGINTSFSFSGDVFYYNVLDTGSMSIGGEQRKFLAIQYDNNPDTEGWTDTLVAGIGTILSYYKPWDVFASAVDGEHEGDGFRCYSDDDIGLFQKEANQACDFITANRNIAANKVIRIYPNPTRGQLTFELSTLHRDFSYQLYAQAAIIEQGQISDLDHHFDISNLPNGFYYLVLQSGDQQAIQKVVKVD